MKFWLRILSIITTAFIVVPALFVAYQKLFPIIYFLGLGLFFKRDDDAFFYGYWMIALLLAIFLSKFILKTFNKWKMSIVVVPCIALTIFTTFAMNVFPYYGKFPDVTIANLVNRDKKDISYAMAHANNGHAPPSFYVSDKKRIEQTFRKYNDPFANAIKLKFARSMSPKKDTLQEMNDTLDFDLYRLFISLPDELIKDITVDTVVYDKNFHMLFVAMIYTNDLNRYTGQIFIGYRQSEDTAIIKLFPFQQVLFPYQDSRELLVLSMRKAYFTNAYGYTSPLDSNFWKAPLFTPNALVDTTFLKSTVWAGHRSPCPFLLIP